MVKIVGDKNCTRCPLHNTAKTVCVMGKGKAPNKIMIVGEAPGRNEDEQGKPFVGRSGRLLDEMLDEAGLDSGKVYVTNAVHCRPPENKTPTGAQIRHCSFWLQLEISAVKPKFVLLLGNTALEGITGEKGIKKKRGVYIERDGIIYFPTYHPSYILHDDRQKPILQKDLDTFKKMIDRGGPLEDEGVDHVIVEKSNYQDALHDISKKEAISYDSETSGLDPFAPGRWIASFGIGTDDRQFCFPLNHYLSPIFQNKPKQRKIIRDIHEVTKNKVKIAQNGKFDDLWTFNEFGVMLSCDFDTMLAHYNLDENQPHSLSFLSQLYFDANNYEIPLSDKQGLTGTLEKHCKYLSLDLWYTFSLWPLFCKMLDEDESTRTLFYNFTMPASKLYTEIQQTGIYLNPERHEKALKWWTKRANTAQSRLDKLVPSTNKYKDKKTGETRTGVNWSSPQQVGTILFDQLKLKPIDKTPTGNNSTSASVLERLADQHEVPDLIVKFRKASKNLSTFIKPWMALAIDGRLHPNFKIHGTVAGRPSAEEPNPQQTPRDPMIRNIIDAPDGWTLVSVDYSQVELRLVADDSGDQQLVLCYQTGVDVHSKTVKDIFSIKIPTKEERKKGKAINFGFIYGMWWKGFIDYARDKFGIVFSNREAKRARKFFFRSYPRLEPWQKRKKKFARLNGYVMSKIGRKRRLPRAMKNDGSFEYGEALRQAVNAPIQGLASDINISSAIEIRRVFPRKNLRIVSTTHDEILMEIKNEYLYKYLPRIKEIMEDFDRLTKIYNCSPLDVPLVVEFSLGPWGGENNEIWKP